MRSRTALLSSFFLSSWTDRMWEFGAALLLILVDEKSLVLPSVYGIVQSLSVVLFGSMVGSWIDFSDRLRAVRLSLFVQNLSVALCAITLGALLEYDLRGTSQVIALTIFFLVSCCAKLGSVASSLCVERDWVVVVAAEDKDALAAMTARIRQFSLVCKLVAPAFFGALLSVTSPVPSAIITAAFNVVSGFGEYALLRVVWTSEPDLQRGRVVRSEIELAPGSGAGDSDVRGDDEDRAVLLESARTKATNPSITGSIQRRMRVFWERFDEYRALEIRPAAIGLALLYYTALSFNSLMVAYVVLLGVDETIIGGLRGLGSVFGLLGTFIYGPARRRFGLQRTGWLALVLEWIFLLVAVSPFLLFALDDEQTAAVLVSGVLLSRLGLWMYDVAVTQMLMESISPEKRGRINGVQLGLQEFATLMIFVAGLIVNKTEDFPVLALSSFGSVTVALVLYTAYAFRERGALG